MRHPAEGDHEGRPYPSAADSVLAVIDFQEKLYPHITNHEAVGATAARLIRLATILGIPIVLTEQNPRGLGSTVPVIREALPTYEPMAKMAFNCCAADPFVARLAGLGRHTLVLTGIETHICVLQTALDALQRGYRVHVVTDATGSRTPQNHELGLAVLRQAGVIVTSLEIVVYEWLEQAGTDVFRQALPLLK
jgi:nicotinamidase-related amidase